MKHVYIITMLHFKEPELDALAIHMVTPSCESALQEIHKVLTSKWKKIDTDTWSDGETIMELHLEYYH